MYSLVLADMVSQVWYARLSASQVVLTYGSTCKEVLSREDFAAKLLKSIFKQYKMERVKHFLRSFRVLPSVSVNPMTDEMSVTFQPLVDSQAVFEDSMALLGEVSKGRAQTGGRIR